MIGSLIKALWLICIAVSILSVLGVAVRFYTTGRWGMLVFSFIAVAFLISFLLNMVTGLFVRGN